MFGFIIPAAASLASGVLLMPPVASAVLVLAALAVLGPDDDNR